MAYHFRLGGNAHFDIMHILSTVFIILGFWLLASSWNVLYKSQKEGTLASTGTYSYIRHPQYLAFMIIMFGFLLQWPTLPTLVMFPILVYIYVHLSKREEEDALAIFGNQYKSYMQKTPAFIPKWNDLIAEA